MESRALVDWAGEDWTADAARSRRTIDDWTAGDDLDFAVSVPRRRMTGDAPAARRLEVVRDEEASAPAPVPALTREPVPARPAPPARRGDGSGRAAARVRSAELVAPAPVAASDAGRRTVSITGRPDVLRDVPRLREVERRRSTHRPVDRVASRPDRIAMWAVALGFVLILIAAASSQAEAATHGADVVRGALVAR